MKVIIGFVILILLLGTTGFMYRSIHNDLVAMDEAVLAAWSKVESTYQRRQDLIPSLVKTVSAYTKHERETLTDITQARAQALQSLAQQAGKLEQAHRKISTTSTDNPSALTNDETFLRYQQTQDGMSQHISRFLLFTEAYPFLQAIDSFLSLQAQLEGTENRINVARLYFTDQVKAYNRLIRSLPEKFMAEYYGFNRKPYFQATEESRHVPELKFNP